MYTLNIRNVSLDVARKFKSQAVLAGMEYAEFLTHLMEIYEDEELQIKKEHYSTKKEDGNEGVAHTIQTLRGLRVEQVLKNREQK